MSTVIRFMETLGQNPATSASEYAAAVALLDTGAAQREALLHADVDTLNALLGGRSRMVCMVAPSEEEAPERAPDKDDEDQPSEGETRESQA